MSIPDLEYVACPTSNCGGQWLPSGKVRQLIESHETFYCPSGHSQRFTGKSEIEELKGRIGALEITIAQLSDCPLCGWNFRFNREGHMRKYHGAHMRRKRKAA